MKKHTIRSILFGVLKAHAGLTALLLLAAAGAIVCGVLPPLALGAVVDNLATGVTVTLGAVLLYFALLALSGLFNAGKEVLVTIFGQKVTHALRSAMAAKLTHLPADFFVRTAAGETTSVFVNDVDTLETLFTAGIISMAVDVCTVLSLLAVIFVKSPGLGLLMLLVTPLLFWLTRSFQKRMLAAQLRSRAAVARANSILPESIRNIRLIHSYRRESYMERRYGAAIQAGYDAVDENNFYDSIYSPIVLTLSAVLVAVMMTLSARGGAYQQFFGMSVGTAVAVIAFVGKVFEPLESIGMELQSIQSAVAGVQRIRDFLEQDERQAPLGAASDAADSSVELHEVHFGYREGQEILHGASFRVEPGETVTLTGRTGAGKSTVFKLLLGLYRPWSGQVLIGGAAAAEIPDSAKRRLFGYVEQGIKLLPGTVRDQITLGDAHISQAQVENALALTGLADTVKGLEQGLDTPCTPALFSQGQLQLLSIARAVAADPLILLLDEITANLDADTEAQVMSALRAVSARRTVLSISHRLYSAAGSREIPLSQVQH